MKFLLAGYFGFGNFGDEAILKYFIDVLHFYYKEAEISVISQSPHIIRKNFGANGIYRFDFRAIIKEIKSCDYLIFPGGSVLQDITSLKSILYYLALIYLAIFFKKKFILLAQGIGPINSFVAQKLTYKFLKKASLVTLRDEKSYDTLIKHDISAEHTADLLWAFTQNVRQNSNKEEVIYGEILNSIEKKKLGIQLRTWKSLTSEKLVLLAQAILKNFPHNEFDYKLICLQKNSDKEIMIEFGKLLHKLAPKAFIEFFEETDIEKNIELLQNMDYMIAMRFHAGLCTINAEKSILMISYDPKTEAFCNELGLKYIDIENFDPEILSSKMLWLKEFNPARTALKTNILVKKSQQNVDFFIKVIE